MSCFLYTCMFAWRRIWRTSYLRACDIQCAGNRSFSVLFIHFTCENIWGSGGDLQNVCESVTGHSSSHKLSTLRTSMTSYICIILRFVRSHQKLLAGDQYGLLGDHVIMTAAATSLGKRHIRVLSVVVATLTRQVLRETNHPGGWVNTLSLCVCLSACLVLVYTHTLMYTSSLLARNDCQLWHRMLHGYMSNGTELTKYFAH